MLKWFLLQNKHKTTKFLTWPQGLVRILHLKYPFKLCISVCSVGAQHIYPNRFQNSYNRLVDYARKPSKCIDESRKEKQWPNDFLLILIKTLCLILLYYRLSPWLVLQNKGHGTATLAAPAPIPLQYSDCPTAQHFDLSTCNCAMLDLMRLSVVFSFYFIVHLWLL